MANPDVKNMLAAMMMEDDEAADAPSDAAYPPVESNASPFAELAEAMPAVKDQLKAALMGSVAEAPAPAPAPSVPEPQVEAAREPEPAASLSPQASFHGVSAGDIGFVPSAESVERAASPVKDQLRSLLDESVAVHKEPASPEVSKAAQTAQAVQAEMTRELEERAEAVRDSSMPQQAMAMRPVIQQEEKKPMEVHQLIDGDLEFKGFDEFLAKYNLMKRGYDYNILGVFGGQSTGKSTLLNRLFATQFQEMDGEQGRSQTTQGVWMSGTAPSDRLIVLDFEGSDSGQREDESFEKKLALFALAMADVLVLNISQMQIGTKYGSSRPLLEKVLEINFDIQVQLLASSNEAGQKAAKKKIQFVVRDYDGNVKLTKLYKDLEFMMMQIWDTIKKPAQYEEDEMEKWFDFGFHHLPHINESAGFTAGVEELRKKFVDECDEEFAFKTECGAWRQSGVPVDGLDGYARSCWDGIVNNRDVNIPTEKELVARHRANEAAGAARGAFRQEMEQLQRQQCSAVNPETTPLQGATNLVRRQHEAALQAFDEGTTHFKRYADVLEKIKKDLVVDLEEGTRVALSSLLYDPLCHKMVAPLKEELYQKLNHLTDPSTDYEPRQLWDRVRHDYGELKDRMIVQELAKLQAEGTLDSEGKQHCSIELQKQLMAKLRESLEAKASGKGINTLMADRFSYCLKHKEDGKKVAKIAEVKNREQAAFTAALDVLKGFLLFQLEETDLDVLVHPDFARRQELAPGARGLTAVRDQEKWAEYFMIAPERVETIYNVFLSNMELRVLEAEKELGSDVNIPPWVYFLGILLGFDEALWLISNPLLIILFLFILAVFAKVMVTEWFEDTMENGEYPLRPAACVAWPYVKKVLAVVPDGSSTPPQKDADAKKRD
eukprot:TRINITY_DN30218_c0_g1_i1.p1 TRINITY_DN30218_c0_g1~~TRINITY_DN30218_c0_g1_i1.p1  ORF type:complete len:891 (+),score=432.89 TRINITY_DN30218_c0_g1_i1:61-2733(+)